MKKTVIVLLSGALLVSSCTTNTGQGAAVGAQFGSILGSAIGGLTGGWRGHDIGTIVGMAGGAAVGAAIGAAADQKQEERAAQMRREREERNRQWVENRANQQQEGNEPLMDGSGFDPSNGGDDRIDFDGSGPRDGRGGYSAATPRTYDPTDETVGPGYSVKYNSLIEIRNARIVDSDHDSVIRAGEECKVSFEIMNRSSMTLYDVQPTVIEVSGNKHLYISPNLHVESIAPNSGVRYTATIKADKRLKDGTAVVRVAVAQGNREITSQVKEFTVQTRRK
jgi:uncharacterized protein YcfJ